MTNGHYLADLKEFDPAESPNEASGQAYENRTSVQSLAISPNGKFFALALVSGNEKSSVENIIEVRDSGTFKLIAKEISHASSGAFLTLAVSVNGTIAIGSSGGDIDLWRAEPTLRRLGPLQGVIRNGADLMGPDEGNNSVTTLAFSPDGETLASGKADGSINVWNVGLRSAISAFTAHPKSISSMAFSRDGKLLASASNNGSVKLWKTDCWFAPSMNGADKECREEAMLIGHSDSILSVAFLSANNLLATASADKTVGLWNTNAKSDTPPMSFPNAFDKTSFMKFSPDGKVFGAVSQAGLMKFWDTATMEETFLLSSEGKARIDMYASLAFSPVGKMLATWNPEGSITLWNTNSRREAGKLKGVSKSPNRNEFSMAFSKMGDRLATWTQNDGVIIYDIRNKSTKLATVRLPSDDHLKHAALTDDAIFSFVAFSPDLSLLAAGSANGDLRLIDTGSGNVYKKLGGGASPVLCIAFSNDGQRLAAGYADNTVKIWKTTGLDEPVILRGHTAPVQALAFSNDGKRLATGSWDASVKIWDTDVSHWEMNVDMWNRTRNRQELLTLQEQGQEAPILSVSFSPDGKTLAAARADNTIRLW
jgi:WD40 repeat protein